MAVPLALAEMVTSLWPALQELALCVNLACRSDLQVRGGALLQGRRAEGHWASQLFAKPGRHKRSRGVSVSLSPQGRLRHPLRSCSRSRGREKQKLECVSRGHP